jgi:hypothetical protein
MDSYRRNELPETVKRYKKYTDNFQEWLMRTAIQRGVEQAAQIAEQATKKKGKKTYKMSTEQQQILVNGVANSKEPLKDTSGLRDLNDAIRSRKEIALFHKFSGTMDAGHAFFNVVLEGAQSKLTTFISCIPVLLKSQDLEDEASTFTFVHFQGDDEIDDGDEEALQSEPEKKGQQDPMARKKPAMPKKSQKDNPLSEAEAELEREFLVLCFLYELNRIREVIREAWLLYRRGSLTLVTAALVTDFAQSYIQQNVAGLTEDLDSYESLPQLSPSMIIFNLFTKLSAGIEAPVTSTGSTGMTDMALHYILCIEAITHIGAYLDSNGTTIFGVTPVTYPKLPFMSFLKHFDTVRKGMVTLPIWDKFTESMLDKDRSSSFLPFGFQIVLDVRELMEDQYRKIFTDVTSYCFDTAKLIRSHVNYEDIMWEAGNKPDYMSANNSKFTNVYLSSLDQLLNWIQELLKTDKVTEDNTEEFGMATDIFVTMHATLAGLSMWQFGKTYHGFSIAKTCWFVTFLSHLYNATRQIGGLDTPWPDLEYIIEAHGAERIFVGGPPTHPRDFLERAYMSTCISSRITAKDFRLSGKAYPSIPADLKKKRGLMSHFPLEELISKYYGPDKNDDRWLKRHAVFHHLHQLAKEGAKGVQTEGAPQSIQERNESLQDVFRVVAAQLLPSRSRKQRKKPHRVHAPEFKLKDDSYDAHFRTMGKELRSHELHSNFDYLSFFRRAFNFVLRIRNEVLFDDALQVARRGDIRQVQDPSNAVLLSELFRGLKIKPRDKKIETKGDEVSSDVVPLEQLKRIAKVLEEVIHKEGDVELQRARMRLSRDWDGLKASYAADDFMRDDTVPAAPSAPAPEEARPHDDTSPPEHTDAAKEGSESSDNENVVEVIEEPICPPVQPISEATHTIVEAKANVHDDSLGDYNPYLDLDYDPYADSDSGSEAVLDSISGSTVVGKTPLGIYHRQIYSRHAGRRLRVKGSGTFAAPRLSSPRVRFYKVHCGVYIAKTRKRTVAFQCYTACPLARLLLGKESKLQRRLRAAVKAVMAQGSCTLLDLQVAWRMAEAKMVDEDEMEWEDEWLKMDELRGIKRKGNGADKYGYR